MLHLSAYNEVGDNREETCHGTSNRTDKKTTPCSELKVTPQREAPLKGLLAREKDPLNSEDVYLLVKQKALEVVLRTVYRALELLAKLKIVDKSNFGDGVSRYDLRKEGSEHFHHHLVCIECGSVEEIVYDLLGDVEKIVEKDFSFQVED